MWNTESPWLQILALKAIRGSYVVNVSSAKNTLLEAPRGAAKRGSNGVRIDVKMLKEQKIDGRAIGMRRENKIGEEENQRFQITSSSN